MDNTENGAGFSTSTIMTNDGRRSPVVSPIDALTTVEVVTFRYSPWIPAWLLPGYCLVSVEPT